MYFELNTRMQLPVLYLTFVAAFDLRKLLSVSAYKSRIRL